MYEVFLPASTPPASRTADVIVAEQRRTLARVRGETTVQLERRRRQLERALHDGAQQQLLALRIGILSAVDHRPAGEPIGSSGGQEATDLVARLDQVVADLHRLAAGERATALESGDFIAAMRELASISGAGLVVHGDWTAELDPASAELCAFVVSEALANAVEHSRAATFSVELACTGPGLRVDVIDDGRGGAVAVPGRGIEGLSRRAGALGGTLELLSDVTGTDVRLHLPLGGPAGAAEFDGPSGAAEPSRGVTEALADAAGGAVQVWFWQPDPAGPGVGRTGSWCDGLGRRVPDHEAEAGGPDRVRVQVGRSPVAVIATGGEPRRVAEWCREHPSALLNEREAALAGPQLERLRLEHERIERRAASFERALRRRLTDRPCHELALARALLAPAEPADTVARWRDAADHVARATELLREIVRRLRVPDDGAETSWTLQDRLAALGRRARVRLDVAADPVDDEEVGAVIERVAEEVLLDASTMSEVLVTVRHRARVVAVSMLVERLPSPVAMALVEELALASHSTLTVHPARDGVRLVLEVPCGS